MIGDGPGFTDILGENDFAGLLVKCEDPVTGGFGVTGATGGV